MAKLMFKSIEPFDAFDSKITCELRQWFRKPVMAEFVGNCTVWHQYPNGKRQPTHVEMWFCNIWQREVWRRQAAKNLHKEGQPK